MKKRFFGKWVIVPVLCFLLAGAVLGALASGGGEVSELLRKTGGDAENIAKNAPEEGTLLALIESAGEREIPAKDLIAHTYSLSEFRMMQGYFASWSRAPLGRVNPSVYAFNESYPIDCIRGIDEDRIYAVYRLADGEEKYFLYCFFEKTVEEEKEDWTETGQAVLMQRLLAAEDFAGISPGDTLEAVCAIDRVAAEFCPSDDDIGGVQENYIYDQHGGYEIEEIPMEPALSFSSLHYLKDGALTISYERADAESPYLVTKVELDPDYGIFGGACIQALDYPG